LVRRIGDGDTSAREQLSRIESYFLKLLNVQSEFLILWEMVLSEDPSNLEDTRSDEVRKSENQYPERTVKFKRMSKDERRTRPLKA
jgi:hypothetical protein